METFRAVVVDQYDLVNQMFRRTVQNADSWPQQCWPVFIVERNYHWDIRKFRQILLVFTAKNTTMEIPRRCWESPPNSSYNWPVGFKQEIQQQNKRQLLTDRQTDRQTDWLSMSDVNERSVQRYLVTDKCIKSINFVQFIFLLFFLSRQNHSWALLTRTCL